MIVIKSDKYHNFFCAWCDKFHDRERTFEIYDAKNPGDYFLMCKDGISALKEKISSVLKEDEV